ncbi:hypothetical protein ACE2C6_005033, partial [Salmonella enterica]
NGDTEFFAGWFVCATHAANPVCVCDAAMMTRRRHLPQRGFVVAGRAELKGCERGIARGVIFPA